MRIFDRQSACTLLNRMGGLAVVGESPRGVWLACIHVYDSQWMDTRADI